MDKIIITLALLFLFSTETRSAAILNSNSNGTNEIQNGEMKNNSDPNPGTNQISESKTSEIHKSEHLHLGNSEEQKNTSNLNPEKKEVDQLSYDLNNSNDAGVTDFSDLVENEWSKIGEKLSILGNEIMEKLNGSDIHVKNLTFQCVIEKFTSETKPMKFSKSFRDCKKSQLQIAQEKIMQSMELVPVNVNCEEAVDDGFGGTLCNEDQENNNFDFGPEIDPDNELQIPSESMDEVNDCLQKNTENITKFLDEKVRNFVEPCINEVKRNIEESTTPPETTTKKLNEITTPKSLNVHKNDEVVVSSIPSGMSDSARSKSVRCFSPFLCMIEALQAGN